jgi:hypothetical protein
MVAGAGGAVFPEDPGDPTGSGICAGIDPDTVDPGIGYADDAPPPEPPDDEGEEDPEPAPDAQWQNTRYVTLANACGHKAKVTLTYETLNDDDEPVEDTVELELNPDEVVDVYQDDWRVNAQRVKLDVTCGDHEIKRFKDKWLNLVPETDENGVPGYPSPDIQRATITIR